MMQFAWLAVIVAGAGLIACLGTRSLIPLLRRRAVRGVGGSLALFSRVGLALDLFFQHPQRLEQLHVLGVFESRRVEVACVGVKYEQLDGDGPLRRVHVMKLLDARYGNLPA